MGWSPGAIPQLDWLSYLRSARTHNSHQAHWSLFLSCFKTWHSLWPLSRQTPSCHRVAARWRMRPSCRGLIAFTLTIVRVHLNAFVSEEVCFQLLQWGHSSKLTCHPGVQMSTDWEPSSTSSCYIGSNYSPLTFCLVSGECVFDPSVLLVHLPMGTF